MTIETLYAICDNIDLVTKVFVIDTDHYPLVWNKMFSEVPGTILQLEVKHYKMIDNEVLIWVP